MSFSSYVAPSWARSPVKAVRNRRRSMQAATEAAKLSPTRVMDFPLEDTTDPTDDATDDMDDEQETIKEILSDRSSNIVRQLDLNPLDKNASQEIAPIPLYTRLRNLKVKILPTLNEYTFYDDIPDYSNSFVGNSPGSTNPVSVISVAIKSKKKSYQPKPSRSERIQELIEQASECAATGDEEEAVKIYKRVFRMADSEAMKLKGQLNKSLEKHPATLQSIQTRIQEDILEVVLLAGKIKTDMTNLYERQGDYENAIETCKETKSIYKKQRKRTPDPTTPTTDVGNTSPCSKDSSGSDRSIVWYVSCPNLDKLSRDANQLLGRLMKAASTFDDRKKLIEEILMLQQEIATTPDARHRQKLYDRAETMAKNAVRIERSSLGDMHPQVADTLQLLSALVLEQQNTKPGSRDKAIQYVLQGLEINQTSLGKKHPRTGQDVLRMASLYQQPAVLGVARDVSSSRQDEDRAVQYFHQAAVVFRGVKKGHTVVGSILNDLAVIHVARREFAKALKYLNESLASYESEVEEEGNDAADDTSDGTVGGICVDAVQVWRNMGECHVNLRDFKQAIECFVSALDMQRAARLKHDSVPEADDLDSVGDEKTFLVHLMQMISDESIADTLRRLGKAFAAAGKIQEATTVYREALQIHRRAVADAVASARFCVNPELPGKQDQLANTLYCIAEVCAAGGDYTAAVRIFNESMQLRIASDGHRSESQRCNMVHCSMCLVGIANVHVKKKEFTEAHKLYKDALFFCEAQGLPFNHSLVTMIEQRRKEAEKNIVEDSNQVTVVVRLEARAESEIKRGELDQAIGTLGEAMTIRLASMQKLKAAGLDSMAEVAATVRLLHTFGDIFTKKGDDKKAHRAHTDAIRLYRKHAPPKVQVSAEVSSF